jgi:hypothetical protein
VGGGWGSNLLVVLDAKTSLNSTGKTQLILVGMGDWSNVGVLECERFDR